MHNKVVSKNIRKIRFPLIVLIVMIHSYFEVRGTSYGISIFRYIQIFLSQILSRIAVPLFFMISAYLLFLRYELSFGFYFSLLKKKIKSLLIPFLIWNVVVFFFFFFLQKIPFAAKYSSGNLKGFSELTFLETIELVFLRPIANQFWFIRDLMILIIVSPLIKVFLDKGKVFTVFIVFVVMLYFSESNTIQYFNFESLCFFVIGAYLSKYKSTNFSVDKTLLISLSVIFLTVSIFEAYVYFNTLKYVYWLHYLNICFGVWVFWNYFLLLNERLSNKMFSLEKYTFITYAMHIPLNLIVYRIIISLFPLNFLSLFGAYMATFTLSILVSILFGRFLNKFSPSFYAIITGNRQ